tara:strand:+ start:710 stop:1000 length:291 start_codon:yes stop_codon:yes gene_type:complete
VDLLAGKALFTQPAFGFVLHATSWTHGCDGGDVSADDETDLLIRLARRRTNQALAGVDATLGTVPRVRNLETLADEQLAAGVDDGGAGALAPASAV